MEPSIQVRKVQEADSLRQPYVVGKRLLPGLPAVCQAHVQTEGLRRGNRQLSRVRPQRGVRGKEPSDYRRCREIDTTTTGPVRRTCRGSCGTAWSRASESATGTTTRSSTCAGRGRPGKYIPAYSWRLRRGSISGTSCFALDGTFWTGMHWNRTSSWAGGGGA